MADWDYLTHRSRESERSWYDVMQVCLKGHVITDVLISKPEHGREHCQKCGAKTISKCSHCKKDIPGEYHVPRVVVVAGLPPPPSHCDGCGKPFPWAIRGTGENTNIEDHEKVPDPGTDVPALAALRKRLSEDQRKILNRIWKYYREQQEWMPTKILHHEMKKGSVLAAINSLGGTVIFKQQVGAREYYELTLLGVLLSDYGSEAEKLLVGYLEHVRAQYDRNPLVEKVTAEEVRQSLQLPEEQTELLSRLIQMGYFYGSSASFGKMWECGVPSDIDDLPAIPDLRRYVQERAVRDYDPKFPIEPNERSLYSLSKRTREQRNEFDFIQDSLLRDQLEKDWDEVQRVREVKAWKSCVILCGGILEGVLLDVLKRDEQEAKSAYKGKGKADLDHWDLIDLVDVAKNVGILSKSVGHLSHALREFRNLIHPGKQVRERLSLTQEQAEIAFNVVKVCLGELSKLPRSS